MIWLGWVILVGVQAAVLHWFYRLGFRFGSKDMCRWVEAHLIEMGRGEVVTELINFCTKHHPRGHN